MRKEGKMLNGQELNIRDCQMFNWPGKALPPPAKKENVLLVTFWSSCISKRVTFERKWVILQSFRLECRTRFCARRGRHGALTFIESAAFWGELPILLCSNLSSICIHGHSGTISFLPFKRYVFSGLGKIIQHFPLEKNFFLWLHQESFFGSL